MKAPKTKPLVLLDSISPFPPVFMLHNQCNWEERHGMLSRDSWRCDSSIMCSLWSSVEISASLTKVRKQEIGLIFSSHILQTSISGQTLMRAVDIVQWIKICVSMCRDSGTEDQLSRQYVDSSPEEEQANCINPTPTNCSRCSSGHSPIYFFFSFIKPISIRKYFKISNFPPSTFPAPGRSKPLTSLQGSAALVTASGLTRCFHCISSWFLSPGPLAQP